MEEDTNKVEYNKAYAVSEYVKTLGVSVSKMMERGDHPDYYFNGGNKNNLNRIEMIDVIQNKAMEALELLK